MKKVLETSISPNYVPDWELPQAVREIVQNTLDENGEIEYEEGTLTLTTKNGGIPHSMLALGNSGKRGDESKIGRHGDGLKVALAVILREKKPILIENGGLIWEPKIGTNSSLGCECVVIEETDTGEHNNTVKITIEDLEEEIKEICESSLQLQEIVFGLDLETSETLYGDLIFNEELKGNVYVNGLYIQHDSNLKYAFNFNPRYVQLDRDRKAINFYELLRMIAKLVVSSNDVAVIVEALYDSNALENNELSYYLDEADENVQEEIVNDYCEKRVGRKSKIAFEEEPKVTFDNVVCVDDDTMEFLKENPSLVEKKFVYVHESDDYLRRFVNQASDDEYCSKEVHLRKIDTEIKIYDYKKNQRPAQLAFFNQSEFKKQVALINRLVALGAAPEDIEYLRKNLLSKNSTTRFIDILNEIDLDKVTDEDYQLK